MHCHLLPDADQGMSLLAEIVEKGNENIGRFSITLAWCHSVNGNQSLYFTEQDVYIPHTFNHKRTKTIIKSF